MILNPKRIIKPCETNNEYILKDNLASSKRWRDQFEDSRSTVFYIQPKHQMIARDDQIQEFTSSAPAPFVNPLSPPPEFDEIQPENTVIEQNLIDSSSSSLSSSSHTTLTSNTTNTTAVDLIALNTTVPSHTTLTPTVPSHTTLTPTVSSHTTLTPTVPSLSTSTTSSSTTLPLSSFPELATETFPELEGVYSVVAVLGVGTFSMVYEAVHLPSGTRVAIKRLISSFPPRRTAAELRVLMMLQAKPNVTQLLDVRRRDDRVSLVMGIYRFERFQSLYLDATPALVASYMRALFLGLESLHSVGLVHRDIKPSNFLFDPETLNGVLSDFGLSHTVEKARSSPPCRSGTRGFRPPEVLLCSTVQSTSVDIWAAGMILLFFMIRRYPCFNSTVDILSIAEIATIFGTEAVIRAAAALGHTVCFNYTILPTPLCDYVIGMNPEAAQYTGEMFHLLESCLQLDPNKRITASDALKHPFLCS